MAVKKEKKSEIWQWVKSIGIAVIVAFILRSYVFAPTIVNGKSMDPTLHTNERLILSKIGEPKRFDIIVFHAPDGRDYVKRVIGFPGETVEIKDDTLFIDGKACKEAYLREGKKAFANKYGKARKFTEDYPQIKVPKGDLFVLGDNRPVSEDSRSIGPISQSKIIGKAKLSVWPLKDVGLVGK
ncbi:signal peptidase I [Priestia koreensis]|uniref:Signal peptidase I n=1 Tax=Priestia koreensis TaxID=284581 RepID=A0A0M0L916_9BACI|nr:signal peptidase I [Priestia koreensis]KOO47514.1 signal peptidase I [Priestia koreensis]